jgi:hypothetical protein
LSPGFKVEGKSPPDAVGDEPEQGRGDNEKGDSAERREIAAPKVRTRQADLPHRVHESQYAEDETGKANQGDEDAVRWWVGRRSGLVIIQRWSSAKRRRGWEAFGSSLGMPGLMTGSMADIEAAFRPRRPGMSSSR